LYEKPLLVILAGEPLPIFRRGRRAFLLGDDADDDDGGFFVGAIVFGFQLWTRT